jgi:GAF domain-containing protein
MRYQEAYRDLALFGHKLLDHPSLDEGLPLIADYAKKIIGAQRCSIFLYSPKRKVLWTTLSDGIDEVVIDPDKGIAGYCFKTGESVVANDPYHDKRFFSKIDETSGFKTENIATVPIFGADKHVIGVFQVLNSHNGAFDEEDMRFMRFFAHFISGYLELASVLKEKGEK